MARDLSFRFSSLVRPAVGLALLLAVAAAVLAAGAGLGARLDWWHFSVGFRILRWGARLGAAAVIVALLAGFLAGITRRWRGVGLAVLALAAGGAALGIPRFQLAQAHVVPPIHDISTDTDHPPSFQAMLPLRAGARNPPDYDGPEVAAQQHHAYPDIVPAHFREPPEQVFPAVERTAREMGWAIAAAVPAEGRLEATATTFWFGFKDDVVVRVQGEDGGGTRVDVRSKSRVGGSDIGTNARRIRRFLSALRASGLTPQG